MTTQHTPGPWRTHLGTYCNSPMLKVTAKNHREPFYALIGGGDEIPANARLIAAAPELLEALVNLVCCPAFNGSVFDGDSESHKAWTVARAAIAKAEGRE